MDGDAPGAAARHLAAEVRRGEGTGRGGVDARRDAAARAAHLGGSSVRQRSRERFPEAVRTGLPWDPSAPVHIDGTQIRIRGYIDRLDLSGDRRHARVTDYKSGKYPNKSPQIQGGAELQRCLYAFAVKTLIETLPEVEACLVYPRGSEQAMVLDDTEETLAELVTYLNAARSHFVDGRTPNGPAAEERWYALAFALPAGGKNSYLNIKRPLAERALSPLPVLWEAP